MGSINLGSNGTITNLAVGGIPDNTIDNGTMADDSVGIAELSATGTASSSTYLRGDNSWATVDTDPTTTSGTNNFTVADGNLVIGTAGHGVDFSANTSSSTSGASMASELLDWYEEGTFTPTVEDWGSETASNATMGSENGGKYTRIGNTVFIQLMAHQTSNSSAANLRTGFYVGGLPFTQDTTDFGCMWDVHTSGITADGNHHVVLAAQQANSQKFRVYNRDYDSNSSGWPDLPTGEFRLATTFHYRCT